MKKCELNMYFESEIISLDMPLIRSTCVPLVILLQVKALNLGISETRASVSKVLRVSIFGAEHIEVLLSVYKVVQAELLRGTGLAWINFKVVAPVS